MKKCIVGSRCIELTSPERILFPADGITKLELIDYYRVVVDRMIPFMRTRALTMHRFPQGIGHEGFYQKNASDYFPSWITTKNVHHEMHDVHYVVCNNAATLVYLANQGCITPHLWLSKIDKIRIPDRLIFDLDPSGNNFSSVRMLALQMRVLLEKELGLTAWVMTTGSKGLHVWVVLKRKYDFDWVHAFARDVALVICARNKQHATLEVRKEKRNGKIFVDYLRNSYAATAVAPYAVRAKKGAPIAMPLDWAEVEDAALTPQTFTLRAIHKRLGAGSDPWEHQKKAHCSLTRARKILDELLKNGE